MSHSVLVADSLAEEGLALLHQAAGFEVTCRTGLSEAALAELVREFDALIVRSGAKVTAPVLASPGKLRVVSRAGVGVDNVDLDAATRAGVIVINTPDANTISTAEHTLALMMALARRVPAAHDSLGRGAWERNAFKGIQLAGKTLGIIGFGRIGRAVAARALGFEMKVIAHDPLSAGESALGGRVRLVADRSELLRQSDVVTLHAALTPQSRHVIDASALALMKPAALLINCARGELVDEAALAEALRAGRLAGAAVDVYSHEPPTDNPLVGLPNVVHTPHLGASTVEAQKAVSIEAVQSVIDFLRDGVIRNAVNVIDLPPQMTRRDQAYVDLADRVGRLLAPLCRAGVRGLRVVARGEAPGRVVSWLARHLLLRLIGERLAGPVSVVNVLELAAGRSIAVEATAAAGQTEALEARVEASDGAHVIEAALSGEEPRIRVFDGHALDLRPEGVMVVVFNDDRPGAIGLVASALGDAGVNIADLAVSRSAQGAMMLLRVDAEIPSAVVEALRGHRPPIRGVYVADLPRCPAGDTTRP